MSKRKIIIIVSYLCSFLVALLPVSIACFISLKHSESEYIKELEYYVSEIQRKSDQTGAKIMMIYGDQELARLPQCSVAAVERMQQLQLTAFLIESVATIEENKILCSSYGVDQQQDLGEPDAFTDTGFTVWLNKDLSFAPGDKFNIYKLGKYAVIVHTNHIVDLYTRHRNVSLGIVIKKIYLLAERKGDFKPEWLTHFQKTGEQYFKTDSHIVAVRDTESLLFFASIELDEVNGSFSDIAYVVIPVSILFGLALSMLVLRFTRERLSIKADIKTALKNHDFYMVYQPVVALSTGEIIGAEALVRWKDSDGQIISPDVFIPVAEQTGLIKEITKEVICMISNDAKNLWQEYPDFHIGINFSSYDMHSLDSLGLIKHFLDQHSISADNIMIEATERGFVDAEKAKKVIDGLHNLGVKVAIDDFGTGYSSLSHLQSLELDYLKIDKAFIDTVCTEAATSSVALHIVEMAKSLNMKIIAEGVETETQATWCRNMGVQYAQGWLFGKPIPVNELADIIQERYQLAIAVT